MAADTKQDLCKYVDVFYGNGETDHFSEDGLASKWFYIKGLCGNTSPHAVLPFGKMSVGAYSGGYPTGYGTHRPNSCGGIKKIAEPMRIRGFSHLHQSGTGGIRYYYNYAIVTPFYGKIDCIMDYHELRSEQAKPGFYTAEFRDVLCELTVNKNTALHRYCFLKSGGRVAVDFSNDGLSKEFSEKFHDRVRQGEIKRMADNEVVFSGMMSGIKLYFCVVAEGERVQSRLFEDGEEIPAEIHTTAETAKNYGAVFDFDGSEIVLKVSYSTIGYEQAREQVYAAGAFGETAESAYAVWNQYLSAITIETDCEKLKEKFYSNLYHSLIKPCDMTGENILGIQGDLVTDFATFWDQYKTAYPLIYLLYPEMGEKIVKSIVNISRTLGKIPCSLGLTDMLTNEAQAKMIGILTLCDAWYSGMKAADQEVIAECIGRELAREDFKSFIDQGIFEKYTHILDVTDGCYAAARIVENDELKEYLYQLGENWIKAYDEDGLMSCKSKYYEGDRYTYSFRLQQNMQERIALAGGKEQFVQLLDEYFGFYGESIKQVTTVEEIPLINEICNRLHRFQGFNNEGDMEAPYAYIYAGRQDRICDIAHEAVEKTFGLGRGGLPGNNDSGGLSSCVIWNALGIFPASGTGEFLLGSPHMNRAVLRLSNGKTLELVAEHLSPEKYHVEKVLFNEEKIADFRISTEKLMQGGKLVYFMK